MRGDILRKTYYVKFFHISISQNLLNKMRISHFKTLEKLIYEMMKEEPFQTGSSFLKTIKKYIKL